MKSRTNKAAIPKRLLCLFIFCLILTGCAQPNPQAPAIGLNADQTGFTVTGVGRYFEDSIVIPEIYTHYGANGKVLEIDASAFADIKELNAIQIPDSVQKIGQYAFSGCVGLTEIDLPDNLFMIDSYTFYNCSGLVSISIPNSVRRIKDHAFVGCTSLTNVDLPDNLAMIDSYAFDGCVNLSGEVDISSTVSEYAFRNTALQKVTALGAYSIGAGAFSQCEDLVEVVLPEALSQIGEGAFANCTSLTSITMPQGLREETLSDRLFYNCTSLRNIQVPEGNVRYIGAEVFYNCDSLTKFTVSNHIDRIGDGCFYDCDGLERVDFIYDPPSIYTGHMGGCRVGASAFAGCDNLTDVFITKGSYKFGADAFVGCENLKNVFIDNILSWFYMEFENEKSTPMCYADNLYLNGEPITGRVDISISTSDVVVPPYTFKNCSGMTHLILPDNISRIGTNAFEGCGDLIIEYPGTTAQWDAIEKDGWDNGLGKCIIHCADTDIYIGY